MLPILSGTDALRQIRQRDQGDAEAHSRSHLRGVSYERREAAVDYDPDKTSREKIVEAITMLSYKASVKA
jgi:hypothetical protein